MVEVDHEKDDKAMEDVKIVQVEVKNAAHV